MHGDGEYLLLFLGMYVHRLSKNKPNDRIGAFDFGLTQNCHSVIVNEHKDRKCGMTSFIDSTIIKQSNSVQNFPRKQNLKTIMQENNN